MKAKKCSGENCNYIGGLWKAKCKEHDGLCKNCALKRTSEVNGIKSSFKTLEVTEPRKQIAKVSDKQKKLNTAYMALRKTYMEQNPKCMFKGCHRPSTECHHVRGRGEKYMLDTSEWMAVCSEHHRHIHDNDKESRELGYLKSRLEL